MLKKAWLLFINTFSISMSANSGYAMLGVIKNRFVDKYRWFSKEEMEDYIALAQSCPGPIGCSSAMIIGYRSCGIIGALSAALGVIIPPFIMMVLVTFFYAFISTNQYVRIFISGMQAGVCAMLLDVVLGLFSGIRKMNKPFYFAIVALSFLYVRLTDFSIFYLALLCIGTAIIKTLMIKRKVDEI
ncbi:MAG: chromate transporter [Erysipelotrichaceae bacterium]|nr:chromate transporter [Erysipelotrichaceae bacterium]